MLFCALLPPAVDQRNHKTKHFPIATSSPTTTTHIYPKYSTVWSIYIGTLIDNFHHFGFVHHNGLDMKQSSPYSSYPIILVQVDVFWQTVIWSSCFEAHHWFTSCGEHRYAYLLESVLALANCCEGIFLHQKKNLLSSTTVLF